MSQVVDTFNARDLVVLQTQNLDVEVVLEGISADCFDLVVCELQVLKLLKELKIRYLWPDVLEVKPYPFHLDQLVDVFYAFEASLVV